MRLRKAHPCGGFNWKVVRLGADIGLVCETCGRRIMLTRPTLERRMKSFIDRGPEASASAPPASPASDDEFPCETLGLQIDDMLEAIVDLEVPVAIYYLTTVDMQSGRLLAGDQVRVTSAPAPGSTSAILEPVAYDDFERRYIPGGIRQQQSYSGYAIIEPCAKLARHFRPISARSIPDAKPTTT